MLQNSVAFVTLKVVTQLTPYGVVVRTILQMSNVSTVMVGPPALMDPLSITPLLLIQTLRVVRDQSVMKDMKIGL